MNTHTPYNTLNEYFKTTFGTKCYKIAVDAGMTCPNRDGKLDDRGCIFCAEGSGTFAARGSINEQIEEGLSRFNKSHGDKFVIYFQAYTNTYGPVEHLRQVYEDALNHEKVIGISIATRPDELGDDVLALLAELQGKYQSKFIWVELGLQTIHEGTASYIRRCYPLEIYEAACQKLKKLNICYITHIILGLPGESSEHILETIAYLNGEELRPFGVKLQLLHVLKGTDLALDFNAGKFTTYTEDEYIDILIQCIEHLHPDIVLHRVTGDGPKSLLISPLWSGNKKAVLNHLHKEMRARESFQGKALN